MKPFYTNVCMLRNRICYRGVDNSGKRNRNVVAPFNPVLFRPAPGTNSKFKNIYGKPLEPVVFEDDSYSSGVKKAGDYIRRHKEIHDFEIYGQTSYVSQFIRKHNPGEIEFDMSAISVATLDIETECENGFPDVNLAVEEITCMTVYESITKTFYVFGNRARATLDLEKFTKYAKNGEKVVPIECANEQEMLGKFLNLWADTLKFPDVLLGWNNIQFDVPYLINRLYRVTDDKDLVNASLSPWGHIEPREYRDDYGNNYITYLVYGIQILDYMELYKKFNMDKQESYALAHIAHVELGEAKLSYEEYDSMHLFYLQDYPKFVEYNLKDVWLINRIEEKIKLLEFAVTLAYLAKVNYSDVYYPVSTIESLCYDYLLARDTIMAAKIPGQSPSKTAYVGAFVKEPKVGLHDWVVSFDLNSLYPSIIRQLNLSPETLVPELSDRNINIDSLLLKQNNLEYLKPNKVSVAANGEHFSHEKTGFIPEVVTSLVDGRKNVKKEMLIAEQKLQTASPEEKPALEYEIAFKHMKQLALKNLANSIYGAMGNQYFAFYDTRLASAITTQGQFVIRLIEGEMNKFMNHMLGTENEEYVLYMDTDSIYIAFEKVVARYKKKTGETDIHKIVDYVNLVCKERVEPWIEKVYERMAEETNAYQNCMVMKREVIASRGVWKAKKMYALYVYDSEGVRFSEPKLKIMGIETQRSSTPEWCRKHLKESIKRILTRNEADVQDYVADVRKQYLALSPSDIAFPRSLNDMNKWVVHVKALKLEDTTFHDETALAPKTPINVRAAYVHNKLIRELGLGAKYREITPGNKIKFLYLKEPNPAKSNVIGFTNSLPEDFGLSEYIDYDNMFHKSFLKPLQNLLDVIGWKSERRNTIDDLFGWG